VFLAVCTSVFASIIASTLASEPHSGPPGAPTVRVRVDGGSGSNACVSVLRGAATVRVLVQNACLTAGSADVTGDISVGRDATSVVIDDGVDVRRHVALGSAVAYHCSDTTPTNPLASR